MTGVRAVTSNQEDLYKNLEQVVRKYAATRFLRPVADHTREAFESAKQFVQNFYQGHPELVSGSALAVILDSGCGTGESTLHLARRFPGVPVIGIDKSAIRLSKAGNVHQLEQPTSGDLGMTGSSPSNAFWVRGELLDFWRLALEEQQAGRWHILHHAVFYPNPWPKESEATRRFHLHPIFPTLTALGDVTELRTNWEIYAREFAEASRILADAAQQPMPSALGMTPQVISCEAFNPEFPETAFERKYKEARQQLWRVLVKKF
ncbi:MULTISPECIES: class I SAM-dependent methyltransferase [unclassified Fibrobacter]|uniref:class I SAM-dependent methyltransferase n=1 Tax=unclassified Fibrobacter TaxID=2634177 RepID=UPI000D6C1858|nr:MULTISPECIES: class I SAM-dependent methyltransferase [unclassified Fibrobacter]PWJ68124.1 tRNA G46 methylase TrmB [Fibrobacter sp. UWR4]PZW71859.1 tRNA G46 methylase TrmB [Fibrobacter sp. UWR1]